MNVDIFLQQILESALQSLKAIRGSVMLIDSRTQTLRIKVSKGISSKIIQKTSLKLGEGIAGFVAMEGKPLLIQNIATFRLFQKNSGSRCESKSFVNVPIISVPLNVFGKVFGVINVSDTRTGASFTTEDVGLLSVLAVEAALVIAYSQIIGKMDGLENDQGAKMGQLASGVADGIQNSLAVISGQAQYLLLHIPRECRSAEILKKIVNQTEKATQMTKKIRRCILWRDS